MQIVAFYKPNFANSVKLPLYTAAVPAGSPDFIDDHIDTEVELADFTKNIESTYFVKVSGDSMVNAGICCGDLLMVDSSVEPINGDIVVVSVNNHFTVKRLKIRPNDFPIFLAENPDYSPVFINEYTDYRIVGVVMSGIHKYRKF
jgi:DNA polymerase V